MKLLVVGAGMHHTDRHMMKLTVSFRNSAKAPMTLICAVLD